MGSCAAWLTQIKVALMEHRRPQRLLARDRGVYESAGNSKWPALASLCVGVNEAAGMFGWPSYFLPVLVRTGHLKPPGKPAQNSRKWFATVELEKLSRDPAWL